MEMPPIDMDVPFADYPPTFAGLQERVAAAMATLGAISTGVQVEDDDIRAAQEIFVGQKLASDKTLASPGTVVHLDALLSEYDKQIVKSAAQIRTYVTNRLLLDSNHPDPRIRLRCYELLGKISDVGLFTDKTEVTMRHRPTEELEQLLRERLSKTLEGVAVVVPELDPTK
jgi:hypothetical protein